MTVKLCEVVRLALDHHQWDEVKKCYRDDFMYLRELEMFNLDDWIQAQKDDFASGKCTSTNRKTIHEDDRSCTWSHDVTYLEDYRGHKAGTVFHIRVLALKKDGLIYRIMISYD